jgi:hypothetical protein
MALADFCSLIVCSLLVLFIVAMVRVELELSERARGMRATKCRIYQISQLPNLVSKPSACAPGNLKPIERHSLLMAQCNFHVVEFGVLELLTHVLEGVLDLVFELRRVGPAVLWCDG